MIRLFLILFLFSLPVKAETFKEIMYLTATICGEARSEPYEGKIAVGWVIVNRGGDLISTVTRHKQFSAWNYDDPNRFLVERIVSQDPDDPVTQECLRAALDVLQGEDPTNGANHYHAVNIKPYWTKGQKPVTIIGNHVFYKL